MPRPYDAVARRVIDSDSDDDSLTDASNTYDQSQQSMVPLVTSTPLKGAVQVVHLEPVTGDMRFTPTNSNRVLRPLDINTPMITGRNGKPDPEIESAIDGVRKVSLQSAIDGKPAEIKARLTIAKLVLINFKSYAGRQEIGPFHTVSQSQNTVGSDSLMLTNRTSLPWSVLTDRANPM
jgi:hypothetical protein